MIDKTTVYDEETKLGYLSEHHSFGEIAEKGGEYAEDLAATMLAVFIE